MKEIRLLPLGSVVLFILANVYTASGAAVMSIDLGSEWLKIGVVSPGVPMDIALNKESKRKTPLIMAYRDGERTFGEDAQSIGVRFPAQAYFYLLDLLGKTIDNPLVDLYRNRFPYYEIVPAKNRNTIVFKNGDMLFTVEELIAQILVQARQYAQEYTGQPITECVIVVPGFFGQAERTALLTASQLANLKVLQLINDYTAVALNYGVFRRTDINETAQYFIFYDMGAQKTTASVVGYQLVRDKATKEINPVIQVLGVGYDRTLGGLEIQLRLRDYLGKEFNKLKKTKTDVLQNPRAMAKLFKEAGRLKKVLSANADHYAQIENLIEDHDFKVQVTRENLEELCSDLWPRVIKPLQQALQTSGLSLSVINQVIIFGGGTRVPKIKEILEDYIQQDLGKNLNADEAAAMGAVYKAADLATGFKVKKFVIKDAVVLPIQVIFERDPGDGNIKQVKRTLFGHMNSYPQKKVITFNKHTHDFDFYVNYADLHHLSPEEISYIGILNISRVELRKIAQLLEENKGDNVETKGIKAHFILDDSGIFDLTGVDLVFEKQKTGDDDESTFSKIGNTISNFFSGEGKEKAEQQGENKTTTEDSGAKLNQTQTNETQSSENEEGKNETVKIVTIKEPVEFAITYLTGDPLSEPDFEQSLKKIQHLNKIDEERHRRESALNALESKVIEAKERLNMQEYSSCATEDEIKKINTACDTLSEWVDENGHDADAIELEKRLEDFQKITLDVYNRHWEHEERPEAIKTLGKMLEEAENFLNHIKNLTKDKNPDKDVFSQVEIDTLKRTIDDTIEWQKIEIKAQDKIKRYETVRLTIKDLSEKMGLLDREVKYLVNKMKIWRPKKVTKKEKKENETVNGNTTAKEQVEEPPTESPTNDDKQPDDKPEISKDEREPETQHGHVEEL